MIPANPAGLSNVALHALRRMGNGEQVECTRWRNTSEASTAKALRQLTDSGLVTVRSTPKARKSFFEFTDKGRALIPAIKEFDAAISEMRRTDEQERRYEERVRAAGPRLLATLHKLERGMTMHEGADVMGRAKGTWSVKDREGAVQIIAELEPKP